LSSRTLFGGELSVEFGRETISSDSELGDVDDVSTGSFKCVNALQRYILLSCLDRLKSTYLIE